MALALIKTPRRTNVPSDSSAAKKEIIAVDFDGTLNLSHYPLADTPNTAVINALLKRKRAGAKIILWTCRSGKELQAAVDACTRWGIRFDAVNDNIPEVKAAYGDNPRKVSATEYWDDKAVRI